MIHLHPPRSIRPLVLGCLLFTFSATATEWSGDARLSASAGFDTNARRVYAAGSPDAAGSLQLAVEGLGRGDGWRLEGAYEVGARKFLLLPSEDTLVQSASGEGSLRLARPLIGGVSLTGKDRRGADRSYTDLGGRLWLGFLPDPRVEVRASFGARHFLFYPSFLYDFFAWEGAVTARYRLDRHHSFTAFGELGARRYYKSQANPPPGGSSAGLRQDQVLGAGVGYSFRGPWQASLTYSFLDEGSNSFGFRQSRHRLTGTAGVRLPWELLLLGQGTVQLTAYPDGIFLSPQQRLTEDDENHNGVSLKLLRPITDRLDVELRAALYQNTLRDSGLTYFRQVSGLGLTLRL